MTRTLRHLVFMPAAILALAAVLPAQQFSMPPLDGLPFRQIGPAAFGGRIDDVEAVPGNPRIIFVGAASGGIF